MKALERTRRGGTGRRRSWRPRSASALRNEPVLASPPDRGLPRGEVARRHRTAVGVLAGRAAAAAAEFHAVTMTVHRRGGSRGKRSGPARRPEISRQVQDFLTGLPETGPVSSEAREATSQPGDSEQRRRGGSRPELGAQPEVQAQLMSSVECLQGLGPVRVAQTSLERASETRRRVAPDRNIGTLSDRINLLAACYARNQGRLNDAETLLRAELAQRRTAESGMTSRRSRPRHILARILARTGGSPAEALNAPGRRAAARAARIPDRARGHDRVHVRVGRITYRRTRPRRGSRRSCMATSWRHAAACSAPNIQCTLVFHVCSGRTARGRPPSSGGRTV